MSWCYRVFVQVTTASLFSLGSKAIPYLFLISIWLWPF